MSARAAHEPPVLVFDAFAALEPGGGIGRSVRDLAVALATHPDAPVARLAYPERMIEASAVPWGPGYRMPLAGGRERRRWTYLASTLVPALADAYYGNPRLVHSPAGYGPTFARARHLLTIHDLTAILRPGWHSLRSRAYLGRLMPAAIRRADRVICDSEWTRGEVLSHYRVDPARVETVHLSISPHFRPPGLERALAHVKRRFELDPPFVLHVGTLEPRKNHVRLIGAFERLRASGFPGPLVLVGREGWLYEPLLARIESSRERDAIRRLGDTDEQDLVALYGACTLFAFPSLEEGFGLPPLEAMACGAAVVTADGSSLAEVVADGAARVDPLDEEAIAAELIALWRDGARREALAARGRQRAAHFTPERWLARMFEIYREELSRAG